MALPVTLTCRQTDSKIANLQEMWINQSERDHEASGQTASHPATHPPSQSVARQVWQWIGQSCPQQRVPLWILGSLTRYATRRFSVIYLKRAASLKKKKKRRRSRKHPVGAQKQVSLSIYDEGALL